MSTPLEPTKEQIFSLRNSAKQAIDQMDADKYDNRDVSRLMLDDDYIRRFLLHHENDPKLSLNMIVETLKWRKQFSVNDITADNILKDFFNIGALFSHNRDVDGCKLLIFSVVKHVKGVYKSEDLQRFFIYWMERLEREEYGKWITVMFDMRDAGMRNMDMEFIQYMINLFKSYYPWILNYILVLEMPLLLNAMWKIIKAWLPPKSVEKIKFVNKNGLPQYIPKDQAFVSWGGQDSYEYQFEAEVTRPVPWLQQDSGDTRKVHFSESTVSGTSNNSGPLSPTFNSGALLQLTPSDELVFSGSREGASVNLQLFNPGVSPVYFKVKTTSPDKFRVRPSVGALAAGTQCSLSVTFLPAPTAFNPGLLVREKFLVIAMPGASAAASVQAITTAFKTTSTELQETRLRVGVAVETCNGLTSQRTSSEAQLVAKVEELLRGQQKVDAELRSLRKMVLFVLLLSMVMIVYFFVMRSTDEAPRIEL